MRHIKEFNQLFESTQELTQEQKDWLDRCTKGTWEANPQTGLVDVRGSFRCSSLLQGLTDFKGVRFGSVSGNFFCYSNKLTSLEGAPQSVGGKFSCSRNSLKSLEGAPQSVGEGFYCTNNELTSLEGAPQSVGENFDCSYNELTSLDGAPQRVGYNFLCHDNPISERAIRGVVKRMGDKKISLEQAVAEYWKWIPQEDRVYLAKHHPSLSDEDKRGYEAMGRLKRRVI